MADIYLQIFRTKSQIKFKILKKMCQTPTSILSYLIFILFIINNFSTFILVYLAFFFLPPKSLCNCANLCKSCTCQEYSYIRYKELCFVAFWSLTLNILDLNITFFFFFYKHIGRLFL